MTVSGRRLALDITPERAGKTVDTLLRRELGLSGTLVKRAKTVPDGILLDGVPARTDRRTEQGQTLSVLIGDREEGNLRPAEGTVDIVHEDEDILIVNKPPGLAVHPGPGHYDDTLGNLLAGYYRRQSVHAGFHPVNRLDRGTSGLMVVAKHAYAQERLRSQLHTGAFQRRYLAVCDGVPEPEAGVVDAPVGRVDGSVLRRGVRPEGAPARTAYAVMATRGGRALVELRPETGRTHQIRVHMAFLGCPLTGDFLYGTEDRTLIARHALHSASLALLHPVTGAELRFSAPLPEDMQALLK